MSILQTIIQASDLFFEIVSNRENLDLKSEIGETLYDSNYRKRVIIPSSVTIGSLNTAEAALKIPSGAGGEIVIDNYGSIQGAGGAAGSAGGDAIIAQSNCRINNKSTGTIYAGGGGGGTGGIGGTGGTGAYSQQYICPPAWTAMGICTPSVTNYTSGGSGGTGGIGGRGRGYDGALTSGSAGSSGSAGGTNAGSGGSGGTGGSGGDWGQTGSSGNSGLTGSNGNYSNGLTGSAGSAGGAAGNYINGLSSYVTFTNNGTVAGGTN